VPELPEVEVVRDGLQRWAAGRPVTTVTVLHPRAIRRHLPGPDDFAARVVGRTFDVPRRRGKYLWLPLLDAAGEDTGEALLGHLGMSGQLLIVPADAPLEIHLRVRIGFGDGGPDLRFVDQRTFGGLSVESLVDGDGTPVPAPIRHIARDPMDPAFDDPAFTTRLHKRKTGIKRALLDQSLVSGIGNIYADEALWGAKLHWARPTETLTRPAVGRLLQEVRAVLGAALAVGGTSFDSLYVNVDGESGYFDRSLAVYGREHEPCRRCGTPIRRDAFMNRSSFTCPHCQPRPRRARW
jgi:formamidopyrimidine-DNA glycosylase